MNHPLGGDDGHVSALLVMIWNVPKTELSVSGGIAVPVGERGHHVLEPWSLDDEAGEGWLRHGGDETGVMVVLY